MENYYNNIKDVTLSFIGGYENQFDDYEEGSDEHEYAKEFLNLSPEEKAQIIYDSEIVYMKKEVRFLGKENILYFIKTIITINK